MPHLWSAFPHFHSIEEHFTPPLITPTLPPLFPAHTSPFCVLFTRIWGTFGLLPAVPLPCSAVPLPAKSALFPFRCLAVPLALVSAAPLYRRTPIPLSQEIRCSAVPAWNVRLTAPLFRPTVPLFRSTDLTLFFTTFKLSCGPHFDSNFSVFWPTAMAAIAPRRIDIRTHSVTDLRANPALQGVFRPQTAVDIDCARSNIAHKLRGDGIPLYSSNTLQYAVNNLGFTGSLLDLLRPEELRIKRLIQFEADPLPSAADPHNPGGELVRFRCDFAIVELEALPRGLGTRPAGLRCYVPGTPHILIQIPPGDALPAYTVLPIAVVLSIVGGRDLLQHACTLETLDAPPTLSRTTPSRVAGAIVRAVGAAPVPGQAPLDFGVLTRALQPLSLILVGDPDSEHTAASLLQRARDAGLGPDVLPSAPIRHVSTSGGATQ